jgi:hypothetical protein
MPDRSRKRPSDANQLGKYIVDLSVGDAKPRTEGKEKNPAAVALGRLGGRKGGAARAAALSAAKRKKIAKAAAVARWNKPPKDF